MHSISNLPMPLITHIMSFLALDEQPESFCAARLACKELRQAGETARRSKLRLKLGKEKLQQARTVGQERALLAFLRRTAPAWEKALVSVDAGRESRLDLQQLLSCLAPVSGSGLRALKLCLAFRRSADEWIEVPKVLTALTTLTALTVQDKSPRLTSIQAVQFAKLSSLTALRSLKVTVLLFSGPLPPQALNHLQQLTRLQLSKAYSGGYKGLEVLGWEHLSACRQLRQLQLHGMVPHLSGEQAFGVWQHLTQLSIQPAENGSNGAGFWRAVLQLPSLRSLSVKLCTDKLSQLLRNSLSACPHLAELKLDGYSRPALPQLPTTLTSLTVEGGRLRWLPMPPQLRSLKIKNQGRLRVGWPEVAVAMPLLTELQLVGCGLQQLPGPLAALSAIEVLDLSYNEELSDLPQQLACLPCLRQLDLGHCALREVPSVLGGGLAVRLEHLNLDSNRELVISAEGLEALLSLTALTHLDLYLIGDIEPGEGVEALCQAFSACAFDANGE